MQSHLSRQKRAPFSIQAILLALGVVALVSGAAFVGVGCNKGSVGSSGDGGGAVGDGGGGAGDSGATQPDGQPPVCTGGTDKDGDGYGLGCPAGNDCDDSNPNAHPGAAEVCDGIDNNCDGKADEGVKNACGTCTPSCGQLGDNKPFPVDPKTDPNVKKADGVGLDGNGDLVLDKSKTDFNFMWIANTDDYGRGTISKIDTINLKEVARYYSVTCHSTSAAGCVDLHGKLIDPAYVHKPSRTAVDVNFDVWVANRAFKGQASATKIANALSDCIDRDKNGKIETSADHNGDGKIETDCNGDGKPDDASTVCSGAFAGKPPEFVGADDECILFTVNYGATNDVGRSICLGGGFEGGASHAWVGTHERSVNRFYKIHGKSGKLDGPYDLPSGHKVYGCVIDSRNILWSVAFQGTINYLNALNPTQVGPLLSHNVPSPAPKGAFYGVAIDGNDHIWLGGWDSMHVWRYKPDRTSFATLGAGWWTSIKQPAALQHSRGIAADNRGKVWVAINNGYLWRIDQSIGNGFHDLSADTNYYKVSGATIIGAGVDFKGNIWGISHDGSVASRLDVDVKGAVILPATGTSKTVPVGTNPYTYSDFTGFGLKNFTRPEGTYVYQLEPCKSGKPANWVSISWDADTPAGTTVELRVRAGDSATTLGGWFGPYQKSPAVLDKKALKPLVPNPAKILELEFILRSADKQSTPVLKSVNVSYSCTGSIG